MFLALPTSAQVNLNSSSGRVNEIKTDFVFKIEDAQYTRPLLQSGWLSGIGDYLSLKHGGGNTEENTYGLRISDAKGFDFGKNNFTNSFFKIQTNGYVGIGTSNPTEKLQIENGIVKIRSNNQTDRFIWSRTDNTMKAGLAGDGARKVFLLADNLTRLTIDGNNGNVGVGTSNPSTKLHVYNGSSGGSTHDFSDLTVEDDDNTMINLLSPNNKTGYYGFSDTEDNFVGGMQYVHTTNSMIFRVNNHGSDVTINQDGNVGVGTNSPTARFHVVGNGVRADKFSLESINDLINDSPWYGLGRGNFKGLSSNTDKSSVQLAGYYGLLLKTANGSFGIHQNGNIGIGTTNPSAKLQVEGQTRVGRSGVLTLDWTNEPNWGGSSNKWAGYIGFNATRNNEDPKDNYKGPNRYTSKGVFEGSNYGFRWLFRNHNNYDSDVQHQLSEYMRLTNSGNLGIGTTAPDAKLTVKGDIHTQEVKVDLNGAVAPDYVFLEDYDLKSIEEVEAYINDQGHLPNIPSAAEMEKNGIELKQMNLQLLEKIEELTLYTIAQEKELQNQKNKNSELETRLEKLEALLTKK